MTTKVPNLTLEDTNGNKVELPLKKRTVLYFYPKDMTPGCTVEACEFRDLNKEYEDLDVQVFGVSGDDQKSHQKFTEKHKLNFPLLVDEGFKLSETLGVYGKKKFMDKEYMGITRSTFVIDKTGKIEKVFENVKAKGHAEEVLNYLK